MSFYGAETWYIKLNKKDLKTFLCRITKLSNVSVKENLLGEVKILNRKIRFIYQVSAPLNDIACNRKRCSNTFYQQN